MAQSIEPDPSVKKAFGVRRPWDRGRLARMTSTWPALEVIGQECRSQSQARLVCKLLLAFLLSQNAPYGSIGHG